MEATQGGAFWGTRCNYVIIGCIETGICVDYIFWIPVNESLAEPVSVC